MNKNSGLRLGLVVVIVFALFLLALLSLGFSGHFQHSGVNGLYANGNGLGTATPVILVNSRGIAMELRVNKTPVARVDGDGTTLSGDLQYGADDLYALGYASSGQEFECGLTAIFTGSTTISASELTTVTVPIAFQVTAPITTAAFLYPSTPTTSTVTLTSLNNTFDAGTTGIQAYYCLLGDD